MDLIMLFSDLFGFYITSCLANFSWNEEKRSFSLVLECFILLEIFSAFLLVDPYHILFLFIFFTIHVIVHLLEIFFYLRLTIGRMYTHVLLWFI